MFESVTKSVTSDFNAVGDSFKVASSSSGYSIYWMNIAVETAGGVAANARLSDSYLIIYKNHTDYPNQDTVSRSGVVKLKADTQALIMSEFPNNEAFWSTFQLDNLSNPLVAFFVASSTTSINKKPIVSFNTVFVNEGDAWDSRYAQWFIAPVSGIYCFSVSSAFVSQQIMNFQILVNNEDGYDLAQSGGAAVMTSGVDLLATSRLIELSVDDEVSVHRVNGNGVPPFSFYSDSVNWAVSFSGFLYSPANNVKVCLLGSANLVFCNCLLLSRTCLRL